MKKTLCTGVVLLATGVALADITHNAPTSVSLQNFSNSPVTTWINGTKTELDTNSAVLYPCYATEVIEIQYQQRIKYIECGQTLELK